MIVNANKSKDSIIDEISNFGKKLKDFSDVKIIFVGNNEKEDYEKALSAFLEWFNSLENEFICSINCHVLRKILPTAPRNIKEHFINNERDRIHWLDKINEEYFVGDISFDYYVDEFECIEIKFFWKKKNF